MANLRTVELKAFVPARDFALSKRFYADMGFTMASDSDGIAYFHHENVAFLLQDFYDKALAENLMLHLLVEDVDAWWTAPARCGHRGDATACAWARSSCNRGGCATSCSSIRRACSGASPRT